MLAEESCGEMRYQFTLTVSSCCLSTICIQLVLYCRPKFFVSKEMKTTIFFSLASFMSPLASAFSSQAPIRRSLLRSAVAKSASNFEFALLFDCDGVILETEELHRQAYNAAFEAASLTIDGKPVFWSVEYYDVLQNSIGGGKPKMNFYFRNTTGQFPNVGVNPPPSTAEEETTLIDDLQTHKTEIYKNFIAERAVARPGIIELMDEALADPRIAVGVCSASTREAAEKVLSVTLGEERTSKLDVCILGDDVTEKKPSPMIYNVARERIGIEKDRCVVIEDSKVGLRAAKAAGMKCIITYTSSTEEEDFYGEGAEAKVPDIASRKVTLESIFAPLRTKGLDAELLEGVKDPMVALSK